MTNTVLSKILILFTEGSQILMTNIRYRSVWLWSIYYCHMNYNLDNEVFFTKPFSYLQS